MCIKEAGSQLKNTMIKNMAERKRNSWSRALLAKLIVIQTEEKSPALHRTRRFH
jgi:hypothetical protein